MRTRIDLSPAAREELSAAVDHLLRVSRARADQFANSYERAIWNLIDYPLLGREVGAGARWLPITGTDFAIVYRVTADEILVIAFPRSSSPEGYWRERL